MVARAVRGNIPAVVTPFAANGDLRLDAFEAVLDWHLANGVDGICVAGDNGESWALTKEERARLCAAAVKRVAGRVPVIMGASAITARDSIAYAALAAEAGADAILLQPQAYVLKGSRGEIVRRYEAVAKAVSIPIVAYNSPRRTGIEMDVDTFGAVCDVAPVVAVKEASRDIFHVTKMHERFADRVAILAGPAPFILPSIAMGARGFISSGPELFGREAAAIMGLGAAAPGPETRRMQFRLNAIYTALMETGTWPSALKHAHGLLGVDAGVPREPVLPLAPEQAAKIKSVMEAIGLIGPRARAAE
ncbi:MAG: dihydrodipicolinate synthase family protein [Alphaproteobacteria bacterium]|nr:dihydrodipicolinate synthase family protein [Alphaproteobacteria bacterium]